MRISNTPRARRLVYAIGAVVVLAIAVVGVVHLWGQKPTKVAAAPVPVTAGLAAREDVPNIVSALGTVQSIDGVSIQARVNGPIVRIEFKAGEDVKEGEELFLIDPRPYQAALDEAQAQLAHDQGVLAEAQLDLSRYQVLAQQNSIAKQQADDQLFVVQQDKGTVDLDQANVETARLNLTFCHVVAPISGRTGALLIDLGNLVGPSSGQNASGNTTATTTTTAGQSSTGTSMVAIMQMQPIYVTFNVPQNTLDEIRHNQAVAALEVDAYSQAGKLLDKGSLTLIDNQVNTSAGTVLMQATFANANEALWPGEFVRARLIVSIRKNAVTLPAQAVMAGPNGSYVYVINSDQTVRRLGVDVAARQGTIAVIEKGLTGGENVVIDGQYRLDEGVKVEIQETAPEGQSE
jgi:multidrug efflux system membrane fusion protein